MLARLPLSIALLLLAACTPGVDIDVRREPEPASPPETTANVGSDATAEAAAQPLIVPAAAAASSASAELNGPFEASPRLKSAELLPGLALTGPGYRIADEAQVVDYYGQFVLSSNVGGLVADGAQVLRLRVRELDSIRALDRISSAEAFGDAVVRGVDRPVTAVQQVASEPTSTASGLPAGIGRFLVQTALNLRDLALDLNDRARDAMEDDEPDQAEGQGPSTSARAQKVATSLTLRYIGYSKARREIARQVGADPYSTNPLLDERLDKLAWASWSGAKLTGLTIGLIGGVAAQALGYAKQAYDLVWELPPEDLKRRNLKVLAELDIRGKPARDLVRRSKAFTLTQQTEFIELLRLPLFAAARQQLFAHALQAGREVHARFLIDAMRMLLNAERQDAPGAVATVVGASPALRRTDGSYVIALPVDYLLWTAEIAAFAWRDDLIGQHNLLLVTGTLSPQALDAFSQAGWGVRERVDPHASDQDPGPTQTAPLR